MRNPYSTVQRASLSELMDLGMLGAAAPSMPGGQSVSPEQVQAAVQLGVGLLKTTFGLIFQLGRAAVCKFGTCIENRHRDFVKNAMKSGILLELTPDGKVDEKGTQEVVKKFLDDNNRDFNRIKLEGWSLGGIRAVERELFEGAREGWTRKNRWYSYGREGIEHQIKGVPPPWQVLAWQLSKHAEGRRGRAGFPLSQKHARELTIEKVKRFIELAKRSQHR